GARRSRLVQIKGREQAVGPRSDPSARAASATLQRRVPLGENQLLPAARRLERGLGQYRYLWMAWLSDADQNQFPVPRFDFGGAARARPRAVYGFGASRRDARDTGMAVVLLQGADARAEHLSRARHFHPADEAQEHAALDARRRPDHAPRARILRLTV